MVSLRLRPPVKCTGTMARDVSATTHVPATAHVTATTATSMTAATAPLRERRNRTHHKHHQKTYVLFHDRLTMNTLDTESLEGQTRGQARLSGLEPRFPASFSQR
jgi:hypothetical protein